MAEELGFVIINQYTLAKSRTGGVISRLLSRGTYELVAARMFSPSQELVDEYCKIVDEDRTKDGAKIVDLLIQYIQDNYAQNRVTGAKGRLMVLLFKGDDVIKKIRSEVIGSITKESVAGETIRDTYGDYVIDFNGKVKYFEPAVVVIPKSGNAKETLELWAKYSDTDGGLLDDVVRYQGSETPETTLVLIKPDNFIGPSSRAGYIVDMLSRSGLYIIASQVIRMSYAQAHEFYGPVQEVFKTKLKDLFVSRAESAISGQFDFEIPQKTKDSFLDELNILNAEHEFNKIITFMTGLAPKKVMDPEEKKKPGLQKCLALVYQGVGAVSKIRSILGTTDPKKADHGTVRREFGSNIMVNTAHASDSMYNALREMKIIRIEDNTFKKEIEEFYKTT
ncbi:MAG: nucleoside-diphosphate kinase [Candidatus Ancaeobacter aquaticus]|nr:nucleoside-diphosphate kinase [Candidatus Ancaeobacter aquaticus]